jgi:hypothetical protein
MRDVNDWLWRCEQCISEDSASLSVEDAELSINRLTASFSRLADHWVAALEDTNASSAAPESESDET